MRGRRAVAEFALRRAARAISLVWLLIALSSSTVYADLGGFSITNFDVELEVRPDATLEVTERIEVMFHEPRHGIYRTIPVRYTDPVGYNYSLGLRFGDVTNESEAKHDTKVTHEGRYIQVRIGSADRTVEGRMTYVIRYRVTRALGHYPQHDEIYWNVTGNEWNQPIERASCTVRLPQAFPKDSLLTAVYTGRMGSRDREATVAYPPDGTVRFEASRSLESLEGMTVAVAFPHGAVRFPSAAEQGAQFLFENWVVLIPLGVLIFLLRRYLTKGRDPQGQDTVMVRYEAPPGATPGEVGAIVDERVDLRDITATLVDLAVRGHIRIEQKENVVLGLFKTSEYSFHRLREKPATDLSLHEQLLISGLFADGDVVDLSDLRQEFYRHIPGIKDAIFARMVQQGHLACDPGKVRSKFAGLGVVFMMLTVAVGVLWAKVIGAIFPHALAFPIVAAIVSCVLFLIFAPAMPQRTKKGVELRAWARGFEEFVGRVERDTLERAEAKNLFESLLPYAMALGISNRWAKKFEGLYADPPSWYTGSHIGTSFSSRSFERGLSGAMAATGSALSSTPRSSGSSGSGGSSGGGGGGGGGGSW